MKPIQYIILGIFIFSAILAILLFQQKSKRIEGQLDKKEFGWNPVAIKRMVILKQGKDSLVLTKKDGLWQSDQKFDAMGIAPQLLVYLSTMQIEQSHSASLIGDDKNTILLKSFDKNNQPINAMKIGGNISQGKCLAQLNDSPNIVLLSNKLNSESLYDLLQKLY